MSSCVPVTAHMIPQHHTRSSQHTHVSFTAHMIPQRSYVHCTVVMSQFICTCHSTHDSHVSFTAHMLPQHSYVFFTLQICQFIYASSYVSFTAHMLSQTFICAYRKSYVPVHMCLSQHTCFTHSFHTTTSAFHRTHNSSTSAHTSSFDSLSCTHYDICVQDIELKES